MNCLSLLEGLSVETLKFGASLQVGKWLFLWLILAILQRIPSITNKNSYNIFSSLWLGPSRDHEASSQSRIIESNPCGHQLFYISKIWYDFIFLWWYVLITSTSLLLVLIGCRWNIRCPNFTPLHFQSHLGLFMGRRIFGEMLIKAK